MTWTGTAGNDGAQPPPCRFAPTKNHISELEHDERMPSLVALLKLAAAIGCKPTDLLAPFNAADLRSLLDK